MISYFLKKIFGTKSDRDLKKMLPLVGEINAFEEEYQKLSDTELKAKTVEFRERLKNGETTDDIMCEAFATVKNACRRLMGQEITVSEHQMVWDMIPYDVQLIGGVALHRGNIAEMATGEGKTLVATMPLYLNALTGRNVQLVTVNDFLASRDADWMGTVYKFLGLTVGCLENMMPPPQRREQYACDITYGTNSEFGFDYLRDMGMANSAEEMVQRDHFYVIIDEIDSILIDEARTPLIISGPVNISTHQFDKIQPLIATLFSKQSHLCSRLIREAREVLAMEEPSQEQFNDALTKLIQVKFGMPTHKQLMHILEDGSILKELEKLEMKVRSDNNRGMLQQVQSILYFAIDERNNEADLTENGRIEISPDDPDAFIMPDLVVGLQEIDEDDTLEFEGKIAKKQQFQEDFSVKSERLHNISQLLKAYCLFEKDVHYVVQQNKVMIVDEHTGRLMAGRRFSDGLHQALEAKEGVKIERETQTLASITIQNYFRMYEKLSGMTGTAETEANEFHQIYKLDVIVIPTNKPCQRIDDNDSIFKTKREKYNAIVEEVTERHAAGQPILLGTVSVDDSELISRFLKRKNIPHNVLNAKNHQRESEIIAQAGQLGAVTVATNMAGRGTDIKLGDGIADIGGLHVIASARHDARRIDRQLRGRCSRQGDPGSSKFYVSLEDNLMRLFGSDRIVKIMERFGLEEGEELQHPWLNRSIETAQKRVEQQHFAVRKRTLEYDDVMNKQREIVYGLRKSALLSDKPKAVIFNIVEQEVDNAIAQATMPPVEESGQKTFNSDMLLTWLNTTFPLNFQEHKLRLNAETGEPESHEQLFSDIMRTIHDAYKQRESGEEDDQKMWLERHIIIEAIDQRWQEHLHEMDYLRSSISLRAYAQKDPLIEYKNEAFKVFETLMSQIYNGVLFNMFRASIATLEELEQMLDNIPQELVHQSFDQFEDASVNTEGFEPEDDEIFGDEQIQITFRREMPKVGRNDPCPCGSGRKYKKCCGK
ncbi:MAG: preprotein translocase subunit SecA [Victivallaceae bacterium]|nr:preprotein translocase subunit SecA [Victivallaceae bacterium]